jgi:predicted RNA-binding protein with PUA-like domain
MYLMKKKKRDGNGKSAARISFRSRRISGQEFWNGTRNSQNSDFIRFNKVLLGEHCDFAGHLR